MEEIIHKIELKLAVMLVKEGDYVVAYCPALELSTHGDTEQEAKEYFEDAVKEFLNDTMQLGTLERCLLKFGWSLKRSQYEPPRIEDKIDFNNGNYICVGTNHLKLWGFNQKPPVSYLVLGFLIGIGFVANAIFNRLFKVDFTFNLMSYFSFFFFIR